MAQLLVVRRQMSKPRTITLFLSGLGFCLLSSMLAAPTTVVRRVHTASGEVVREHHAIDQIKHDWLPELLLLIGLILLAWAVIRCVIYFYGRIHKPAA